MNASKVTDSSFIRDESAKLPTLHLPLNIDESLVLVKVDEDADKGYGYKLYRERHGRKTLIGSGYFDGFGCLDRPNDVIHFVRAYVHAFYRN